MSRTQILLTEVHHLLSDGKLTSIERTFLAHLESRLTASLTPLDGSAEWFDAIYKRNFERTNSKGNNRHV